MLGLGCLQPGYWWLDVGTSSKRALLGLEPAAGSGKGHLVLSFLIDLLDSHCVSCLC